MYIYVKPEIWKIYIPTAVIMNITVFKVPWRRKPHVTTKVSKYLPYYTASRPRI
jgi:hypothetical protein